MTPTNRIRSLLLVIAVALIGAACGNDTVDTDPGGSTTSEPPVSTSQPPESTDPTADDLAALQPNIGCGDAVWSFATPDDDLLVRITVPALLASIGDEKAIDRSYDLSDPDSGASAVLEAGMKLGATECNDVLDGDYVMTDTWEATAGTVRLEIPVVPDGPLEPGATPVETILTIEGVTFDVGGESIATEALTLSTAVGWYAG